VTDLVDLVFDVVGLFLQAGDSIGSEHEASEVSAEGCHAGDAMKGRPTKERESREGDKHPQ
jgi:hypothetical protein